MGQLSYRGIFLHQHMYVVRCYTNNINDSKNNLNYDFNAVQYCKVSSILYLARNFKNMHLYAPAFQHLGMHNVCGDDDDINI